MAILISKTPEETSALGERMARAVRPGMIVGLIGGLGAGKTQLIKGMARGLGLPHRIHSPTFALINEYQGGPLPCFHLDLYRLGSAEEIISAGLEQYLIQPEGVSLVEWFDRWTETGGRIAPGTVIIRFRELTPETREIQYEGIDP